MYSAKVNSKSSSYLFRNPHSYNFRMGVPADLRDVVGKREFRYSLKTGKLSEARKKARLLAGLIQQLFVRIRSNRPAYGRQQVESMISGLGGMIFGFHFSSITTLTTTIWTGIGILGSTFFMSFLFVRTNKIIILTRKKLKEQKAILDKELEEAASYVKTMLPPPIREGPVQIDWRFFPSASLGGDAFGYQWLDDNHFAIYLLDVSGHGVGAALLSVSVLNTLRSQSLADTDFKRADQVLERLNMAFQGERHNDMFFTFWYGVYNTSDRSLTYAGAGHPPALLFMNESNVIELKTRNFVVGGMPDVSYKQNKLNICNGASLYIFSDGVYEVEQEDGSMWKFSDYVSLLSEINSDEQSSLDRLFDQTLQRVNGDKFEDDYTILRKNFT
ncbi:SpoIIE family protein phosphatase [Thermodesulfobacteriota bacterium]